MHCETKPKQYVQGFFQGQSNKKKTKLSKTNLEKLCFIKKRSKLLTLHVPWHCLSQAILQQLWNSRFGKHGIHFLENKAACSWKGASCNIFWERTHVRSWKAAPCNVLGQGDWKGYALGKGECAKCVFGKGPIAAWLLWVYCFIVFFVLSQNLRSYTQKISKYLIWIFWITSEIFDVICMNNLRKPEVICMNNLKVNWSNNPINLPNR